MNEDTSANNLSGQKPLGENLEIEVKFLVLARQGKLLRLRQDAGV